MKPRIYKSNGLWACMSWSKERGGLLFGLGYSPRSAYEDWRNA